MKQSLLQSTMLQLAGMIDSHRHCLYEIRPLLRLQMLHFGQCSRGQAHANIIIHEFFEDNASRTHRASRKLHGPRKIDTEPDYGNSAAQMMSRSRSWMVRSDKICGYEREEFDEVTTGMEVFGYYHWIWVNHVDA